MRYVLALVLAGVLALGVAAVAAGEADDSPGLQLIGVALIAGALVFGMRSATRSR